MDRFKNPVNIGTIEDEEYFGIGITTSNGIKDLLVQGNKKDSKPFSLNSLLKFGNPQSLNLNWGVIQALIN